jgi:hypothetical protein
MADLLAGLKAKASETLLPQSSPIVAPQETPAPTLTPQTPTQAASQVSSVPQNEQAGLQRLVSGISGKAGGGGFGAQEDVAVTQAASASAMQQRKTILDAIQTQQTATAQEQEAQFQQMHEQDLQIKEQAADVRAKMQQRMSELLSEFSQQGAELDLSRQKAKAEQAGFLMRMGNDKYVAKLRAEAKRAGLINKAKFQEAAMETAFEQQADLMKQDLRFRSMLRADERSFNAKLAKMDVNMAWNILMAEIQDSATQAKYGALSAGVQASIKGLQTYATSGSTPTPPAPTQTSKDFQDSAEPVTMNA